MLRHDIFTCLGLPVSSYFQQRKDWAYKNYVECSTGLKLLELDPQQESVTQESRFRRNMSNNSLDKGRKVKSSVFRHYDGKKDGKASLTTWEKLNITWIYSFKFRKHEATKWWIIQIRGSNHAYCVWTKYREMFGKMKCWHQYFRYTQNAMFIRIWSGFDGTWLDKNAAKKNSVTDGNKTIIIAVVVIIRYGFVIETGFCYVVFLLYNNAITIQIINVFIVRYLHQNQVRMWLDN
jgi:hypothetical protein